MTTCKIVVVGDCAVGKTAISKLFAQNDTTALDKYIPTTNADDYECRVTIDNVDFVFQIADASGSWEDDTDRFRPLSYALADGFLVCYSVVSPKSFENLQLWIKEVQSHSPDAPFVIVGTQSDLRNDADTVAKLAEKQQHVITFEEGDQYAKEVGAVTYLECSARNAQSVMNVFEGAVRITKLAGSVDAPNCSDGCVKTCSLM